MNQTMFLKFIFLIKKHVSDETSSIVSCTMRNEIELRKHRMVHQSDIMILLRAATKPWSNEIVLVFLFAVFSISLM